MTTNSSTGVGSLPILYADDYGFHTGSTWYSGRFRAGSAATGVHLVSDSGGGAQAFSAWLNGTFLGSSTSGSADFTFPAAARRADGDDVLTVLTVNMGHEEDYNAANANKAARGLTTASLLGAPVTPITWRLQGVRGGEREIDPVRGPLSTGGLYGERAGWSLLEARATLYGVAGLLGVLAGLALTGLNTTGDANVGGQYTLLSIAAVIVGGGEFFGGIVSPAGAVVGALIMLLTGSLLSFLNVSTDWQLSVQGLILIAVLASRALVRRSEA